MGPREGFVIWGAGGHGRVVADLLLALGHSVMGFVDHDGDRKGVTVAPIDLQVLFTEAEWVRDFAETGCYPTGIRACALGVGRNETRLVCLRKLGDLPSPPLVHPQATVSRGATLGKGSVVFAGAVVNVGARIGDGVIVNSGAIVEHDCVLEDGVHISPGATLCGGVRVDERTWIGAGATIIHQVVVGRDAIVGAGSVVIRDTPDRVTVSGTPATIHNRSKS